MRYHRLGDVPAKRHAVTRRDGRLLTEEVIGYEGFSGNESIAYHLHSPCRVGEIGAHESIVRAEWVPDAHVHRLADLAAVPEGGDPIGGRRLLMWNGEIEVSLCKPTDNTEGFYRDGEGDEVIYVHRGSGAVRSTSIRVPSSSGSASTHPASWRRRTGTATAMASCSSTRRTRSATSIRRSNSIRAMRPGHSS